MPTQVGAAAHGTLPFVQYQKSRPVSRRCTRCYRHAISPQLMKGITGATTWWMVNCIRSAALHALHVRAYITGTRPRTSTSLIRVRVGSCRLGSGRPSELGHDGVGPWAACSTSTAWAYVSEDGMLLSSTDMVVSCDAGANGPLVLVISVF